MAKRLDRALGSSQPDGLVNHTYPPTDVFTVDLRDGQGPLARGTVLALSGGELGDGKRVVLGTEARTEAGGEGEADKVETLTANCVLADPIATGETRGLAYRTGHLNRRALIVKDGYTFTATDEEELRKGGILLSDSI